MRPIHLLASALLLSASSPALATGGFDCRTTDGSNLGISGSVGRVVGSPLISATLDLGTRTLSTNDATPQIVIARSWLDERETRVDLADPQLERFEAKLRVRMTSEGEVGTLERNGRSHPVTCESE